jgi:hypothetical protein
MTHNKTQATLEEVLQPRPFTGTLRCVQPAQYSPGSPQERLVSSAARTVRDIYLDGTRNLAYDAERSEAFWSECAETMQAALEVEQVAADDHEAAIALSVFERAGFFSDRLRPTTLRAQVEMQIAALDAARQARWMFARQSQLV